MKLANIRFLAKNNIRGNGKSKAVVVLMCILALSVTLIASFSITVNNAVNLYKQDVRARMLEVEPWNKSLTEDVIDSIKKLDHVENVFPLKGMRMATFNILDAEDSEILPNSNGRGTNLFGFSLVGDEKRSVIAGKTLEESPTFSCIVPKLFYPYDDYWSEEHGDKNDLEYIDGESLIGKTLTIKPILDHYYCDYNFAGIAKGEHLGGTDIVELPAVEYKLKVVGVYYSSPTQFGYYDSFFVSEETGQLIEQMAFEASDIDLTSKTSKYAVWYNTESLRNHYLFVDDYENIDEVVNSVMELGVDIAFNPELEIRENVKIMANILSLPCYILIFAIAVICIINIIQSTTSTLKKRKSEIGLLKAVGYKDRQIFLCFCYEQLSLTFKGFVIGGGLSAIIIAVANFINQHRTYNDLMYIVSWGDYFMFLSIAFAVAVIVPLLCQLIAIHKLSKIQPKDVMN